MRNTTTISHPFRRFYFLFNRLNIYCRYVYCLVEWSIMIIKGVGIFKTILLGVVIISVALIGCAPQEEVVLTWPSIWVGQDAKAAPVAALVEQFNQQYSGQYRVEVEDNPDYDGYRDKINALVAAGDVPDIFIFNPDPTTYQFYEGDLLFDFSEQLSGEWGARFVDGSIQGATRDGQVKSIPYEIALTPIWYNQALFEQAGIEEFPVTIEEFWQAADALVAAGIAPTSQMTGGNNAWTSMLWYSHLMGSLGGASVWDNRLPHDYYVEAADIMQRIFQQYTTRDAVGGDAGVSGGHFLSGRTAIFINGPWYIGRIRDDAPEVYENVRLAPAPALSGGEHGHQVGFPLSNLAAANTDDPKRAEAVIAFMQWMTEPQNVRAISLDSGSLFAVKFDVGDADLDPLQRQFIEASSNATFIIPHFQSQYSTDLVAEFGQNLGALALDDIDSRQFAETLAQYDR